MKLAKFWEISIVYFKNHVYLWVAGIAVFLFGLTVYIPSVLIFIMAGGMMLWLFTSMKFGWTGEKVRNLLMYKQLTKEEFTPLETEVLNKYFGKGGQRKELILDLDIKHWVKDKVYWMDVISVSLIIVGILLYVISAGVPI